MNFLVQLCDTNTMKTIAAESLMMKIIDVERTFKERRLSSTASSSLQSTTHPSVDRMDSSSSFSSVLSSDSMDEIVNRTFLDFLMDFVTQFEFPQKIVTFLLHLLPNTEYKVHVHCTVNPLVPKLKIYILLTILCTSLMELHVHVVGRICLNSKTSYLW